MRHDIYLDHNATAPLSAEVADAMCSALRQTGNASSVHAFGRRQRQRIEEARAEVATLAGVPAQNVVFTAGGTEANNLALRGTGCERVLVSAIEHPSVLQAADNAGQLSVTADGIVDLDNLKEMLASGSGRPLVSVMLANNETGVIQPIDRIAEIVGQAGGLLHCDMVQAAGRLTLDEFPVAMASLSAHKIGGPQGVGALVFRRHVDLAPVIRGGGQERGRRAGTENVAGIVGFGVAARLARQHLAANGHIDRLRDAMEDRVRTVFPDAVIFGEAATRLPNTSCFAIPGLKAETQIMALDLAGIAVSAGSACSSGKVHESHVLRAMGVPSDLAHCAIRVSYGAGNDETDGVKLVDTLAALRRRSAGGKSVAA
jgi:cysteine desulfurase